MQILAVASQIDNRVTDQLSRAMVGRLAATVNREQRMRQMRSTEQARFVRRPADGVNRLVLEKK